MIAFGDLLAHADQNLSNPARATTQNDLLALNLRLSTQGPSGRLQNSGYLHAEHGQRTLSSRGYARDHRAKALAIARRKAPLNEARDPSSVERALEEGSTAHSVGEVVDFRALHLVGSDRFGARRKR